MASKSNRSDIQPRRSAKQLYIPPNLRSSSTNPTAFAVAGAHVESIVDGSWQTQVSRRRRRKNLRDTNPLDLADEFNQLDLSGTGINFDAYEDIPVEVTGIDVPPPAETFADINLGDAVNLNIRRCRYLKPTPVQKHAIPIALAGRDLMACAQTGSGKTAAFCFPIIAGIIRTSGGAGVGGQRLRIVFPAGLILSPTRELAMQIHEEAKKFSYGTGVKVVVIYGGAPMYQQLRELERGVDLLVATPGRLVDLIDRGRVSLQEIKYLVLDEADRMLDMGFERQIRRIIQQMDMNPPGARQTLLFSATFPHEIQDMASEFLMNYIFLSVGKVGSSTDLISQKIEYVSEVDKRRYLKDLLHAQKTTATHGKQTLTLVFVETKRAADSLERWLCTNGFSATSIHGDKRQPERDQALRSFKSGATPIMVATDVAARGLDIPNVAHVINFELPKNIDGYVHRIGRTGRAGKYGLATSFFNEGDQPLAKALSDLMQESNQEVPQWLRSYAEQPSYGGRSGRAGGRRFDGYDYRSDFTPGSYHNSEGNCLNKNYYNSQRNYYDQNYNSHSNNFDQNYDNSQSNCVDQNHLQSFEESHEESGVKDGHSNISEGKITGESDGAHGSANYHFPAKDYDLPIIATGWD